MRVVAALAIFATAAFILYGWGWVARRLLGAKPAGWAAMAASGMAALVFLGGVLNLARLAYPWALLCVAAAGIVFAVFGFERPKMSALARFLIPGAVLLFAVATQVPPQVYNFHDDFQKYFVHPVRMLETGTVFGSPLNDIGADTLGGQAFLDGFAVAFFPIQYVNGVAALALFLCMMLASQYRSIVATLGVFVINPQYVNISALYTGSFLMMAAIMEEGASAAVTGLLYAGLIAMKSTFLLFVAAHLAAIAFALGLKRSAQTAGFGALFLAPWILVHAPHYAHIVDHGLGVVEHGVRDSGMFNIFSPAPLSYGSTPLIYTGLMLAVAMCGVLIAKAKGKVDMIAASCFSMMAAYVIMVYLSGPRNAGYDQAIRYFTPFAIAAAPVAFGAVAEAFSKMPDLRWMALAVSAIPLLGFIPSLRDRVEEASHYRTMLAFPWLATDPEYLAYNRQVLYGDMRQRVHAAQSAVPPGEEAVVWINAPFYLNFTRNPLADIEPGAGLITPWAKFPDAHYVIYEYQAYANKEEADYLDDEAQGPDFLRLVAAARLDMTHRMNQMLANAPRLYDDGGIVVFHR